MTPRLARTVILALLAIAVTGAAVAAALVAAPGPWGGGASVGLLGSASALVAAASAIVGRRLRRG